MAGVPGQAVDLASPNNADTVAPVGDLLVKAGPGVLYGMHVHNSNTSGVYFQTHNTAAVAGNSAIPVSNHYCPTGPASMQISFGERGKYFSVGIALAVSTTVAQYTSGTTGCWMSARYR